MPECPSHFLLLQWQLQEAPKEQGSQIEDHLAQCASCRAELAEIRADSETFARDLPAKLAGLQLQLQREPAPPPVRFWSRRAMVSVVVAAAAAVLIALLLPRLVSYDPPPDGPPTRLAYRGALSWQVVVRRGGEQFLASEGGTLLAGDALRFVINTAQAGYLRLVVLDQLQRLTPLHPASGGGDGLVRIGGAGRHELPGSVVLDEEAGERHFFLLFAPAPFDGAAADRRLRAALQQQGTAERPSATVPGVLVKRLNVLKAVRPP